MSDENKKVCNQCPNHCPITDLKCSEGRKALKRESQGQTEYTEKEGCWGHGGHYEGENRPGRGGRHEREGRSGRDGYREGGGDFEREGRHEKEEGSVRDERHRRGGDFEREGRHERGGHHGERGHHEGRMHGGYHGGGRLCMDEDTLPGLMQACGHQIYHRGRRGGGQEGILSILAEKEQMSQKELQEILQIQPGSMSEILMKLEQKGLIIREKDSEDKRKSIIRLTSTGKEATKEQKPRMDEDNMFSVLSDEEQALLKTMLKKLLDFWRS